MRYQLHKTLSGKGGGPERFRSTLRGVALDAGGTLYCVGDREVKVFDRDGGIRRRWRIAEPGLSIATSADGRVLVGESGQIEIFDTEGKLLSTWKDPDRLALVTAVGAHEDAVFAADARAPTIRRFDRDGRHVFSIGEGSPRRSFAVPGGYLDFCIDAKGVIHATNPGKHRVERYAQTGELLGKFGHFGMQRPEDFRGCCNPVNVAVAKSGRVIVAEKAAPRTKIYDSAGSLLTVLGEGAIDPECKYMDLAVDEDERLYVADSVRLAILVFAPVAGTKTAKRADRPTDRGTSRDG